jgi:hypothetical protein
LLDGACAKSPTSLAGKHGRYPGAGRAYRQPVTQGMDGLAANRHHAGLGALAGDPDHALIQVDVIQIQ